MDKIITIFGSEDQDEIKKAFKDVLISRFKADLKQYDYYLFDPKNLEYMAGEAIQEAMKEFKETIKEILTKQLETMNIEKLLSNLTK